MNIDYQRIAIASVVVPWKESVARMRASGSSDAEIHSCWLAARETGTEVWPDFVGSLDAMHEAEHVLEGSQRAEYADHLERLSFVERGGITYADFKDGIGWDHYDDVFSTAGQRAEAFLRALGLWVE